MCIVPPSWKNSNSPISKENLVYYKYLVLCRHFYVSHFLIEIELKTRYSRQLISNLTTLYLGTYSFFIICMETRCFIPNRFRRDFDWFLQDCDACTCTPRSRIWILKIGTTRIIPIANILNTLHNYLNKNFRLQNIIIMNIIIYEKQVPQTLRTRIFEECFESL